MSLVEDYMNTQMVTRLSSASILDVSKAMSDWKISSVPISDQQNKRIIGILTERDLVRSIARGARPDMIVADSIMSTPVFSVRNNRPIEEAARLMVKNKVRHLIVEDADHGVVGIITTTDLARYLKHKITQSNQKEARNELSDLMSEVWELFF